MAKKYLGETFDIHGGGIDLVFPHHENEIAQSSCCHGEPLANFWMHNGHLGINGEKMSKSLGNFFTVREKLTEIPGEVIRLILMSTHYRQPLDWTNEAVLQAQNVLDRFYTALQGYEENPSKEFILPAIIEALSDDLNMPLALSHLHGLVAIIHKTTDPAMRAISQAQLKASGLFLGLLHHSSKEWFQKEKRHGSSLSPEEVESLLHQRQEARKKKDFSKADAIRLLLEEKGIMLEDGAEGTTWRYT